VDVRIGVTYSVKELEVQLPDDADGAEVRSRVEAAVASDEGVLWLTDRKGREVGVPADKIAYVEIGAVDEGRTFGFSA
jgi:hypothetical protein